MQLPTKNAQEPSQTSVKEDTNVRIVKLTPECTAASLELGPATCRETENGTQGKAYATDQIPESNVPT